MVLQRGAGVICQRWWWCLISVECNVKCGGIMWRAPHLTTTAQYFTQYHISFTYSVKYHQITHHMAWCGIVWCGIWCDVGWCALFILTWLCCGIMCNVDYVSHGVRVLWCHAMSDEVWNVTWCGMMWCMGNTVVCCARCEMWLRNTECGTVWRHIRHGGVMWNDGWNAVWDVCCGLECVPWDSGMCNLYLNVVMCMAWGGMWAWCGMMCRDVVEWFDVNYGAMWNVVWCVDEMLWCWMWVWCGSCGCGMVWDVNCGCKMRNMLCF